MTIKIPKYMEKIMKMKEKLSFVSIEKNEMNVTKAGAVSTSCGCSCYYANSGGSGTFDNAGANADNGLISKKGDIQMYTLATVEVREINR